MQHSVRFPFHERGGPNRLTICAYSAVTMPHRRCVCFWAKASMFKNPIAGWTLTSSGAIPVRRNPNSAATSESNGTGNGSTKPEDKANDTRTSLFRETFEALDIGEVIGLFPEGTSYTEPQIAQIKDGASYVALEYARWQKHQPPDTKAQKLTIVPVGVVYTNKSRYQSRVSSFCVICVPNERLILFYVGVCALRRTHKFELLCFKIPVCV